MEEVWVPRLTSEHMEALAKQFVVSDDFFKAVEELKERLHISKSGVHLIFMSDWPEELMEKLLGRPDIVDLLREKGIAECSFLGVRSPAEVSQNENASFVSVVAPIIKRGKFVFPNLGEGFVGTDQDAADLGSTSQFFNIDQEFVWKKVIRVKNIAMLFEWVPANLVRKVDQSSVMERSALYQMTNDELTQFVTGLQFNHQANLVDFLVAIDARFQYDSESFVNPPFRQNACDRALFGFASGALSLSEAEAIIIKSLQASSIYDDDVSAMAAFVTPAIQQILISYRDDFEKRFSQRVHGTEPSEKGLESGGPARPPAILYLLRLDIGRLFFSSAFWLLMGSFIGGITLGGVLWFVVMFVINPLYDLLAHNVTEHIATNGAPIPYNPMPFGKSAVESASSASDIQRATLQLLSLRTESENKGPQLSLYCYAQILSAARRSPELVAAIDRIQLSLAREPIVTPSVLWVMTQRQITASQLSHSDPDVIFLLALLGLSKNKPRKASLESKERSPALEAYLGHLETHSWCFHGGSALGQTVVFSAPDGRRFVGVSSDVFCSNFSALWPQSIVGAHACAGESDLSGLGAATAHDDRPSAVAASQYPNGAFSSRRAT